MKPYLWGRCAARPVKPLPLNASPPLQPAPFTALGKSLHILPHLHRPWCRSLTERFRGSPRVCVYRRKYVFVFTSTPPQPPLGLAPFPAQSKSPLGCLAGLNPTVKIKTRRERLKENARSHPVFPWSFSEGA